MSDEVEIDKMVEIATKFNSEQVAKYLIQNFGDCKDVIERNWHKLVSLATVNNSFKLLEVS
jgi:hypothetical protein